MAGGARRDDVPLGVNSSNGFAALETLRRKKKSDKDSSKNKGTKPQTKDSEAQVFWAPTPLTAKSWADVDDDDDYFATTAPLQSVWSSSQSQQQTKHSSNVIEESESEEDNDMLDEGDDASDDEHDHEHDVPATAETVLKKPPQAAVIPKETERQLSKKELKKKELAELDAVLAELGLNKPSEQDELQGDREEEKKPQELNGAEGSSLVPSDNKASKKKRAKKDKSGKEAKDLQDPSNVADTQEAAVAESSEPAGEEAPVDVKDRLKKIASLKKKKSGKEMDAAAKAAAIEAAARSAKLAAAKKKEKSHYNQQPVR